MKKNNSRFNSQVQKNKSAFQGRSPRGNPSARGGRSTASGRSENQIPREWRIIVGNHAIKEAILVRPSEVKGMWVRQGWEQSGDLRELYEMALSAKVKIDIKAEAVIEKFGTTHQGAALFVDGGPEFYSSNLDSHDKSIVLMLDGIEDPHNLGAIVRTSWLIGVDGILTPEDRAVGLTPTVHKVACGGVEHVPVKSTTNFSKYSEELKEKGFWIFGLSPRGKKSIFELELPDKVVWAIGAEDKGLRVTTERLCDELVYIPQASISASYNASVATAMALSETLRQHAARGNIKKS